MIVLHAVMMYDWSIGTREAGAVSFVRFTGPRVGPAGRLHGNGPQM